MINPFHPGVFLQEILDDFEITPYRLAQDTHMPATRVSAILKHRRSITVDTAMRLSAYFDMSEQYWLNLQNSYDLAHHQIEHIDSIAV